MGFTVITTWRSRGPPIHLFVPTLRLMPDCIDTTGILRWSWCSANFLLPWHLVQDRITFLLHYIDHMETLTNCPKAVCCVWEISPLPLHAGQVVTSSGFFAPVPLHCGQFSIRTTSISFLVPKAASSKVIVRLYRISAPLAGPRLLRLLPPKPAPPKNISKMSPKPSNPPKSKPPNPWPVGPSCPNWSYCALVSRLLSTW